MDSSSNRLLPDTEEGNLIKTKPAGKTIRISKQSRLEVTDKPLGACEVQFGGVLTDVYQRVMTTEQVEMLRGKEKVRAVKILAVILAFAVPFMCKFYHFIALICVKSYNIVRKIT